MAKHLEGDLQRVVNREGLEALMLSVEYHGPATCIGLRSARYSAFSRVELNTRVCGIYRIPVVFPFIPDDLDTSKGVADGITRFFASSGMRGLNIPETDALAKRFAGTVHATKIFRGIGQTVRGQYDEQVTYATGGGIGLFPRHRVAKDDLIPATWVPDPLIPRLAA